MSDDTPAPGHASDQPRDEPGGVDEAREAAMMRAVMRAQEKHREGGVDRDLDEPPADPGSQA